MSKLYKIIYDPDNSWCGSYECCSPNDGFDIMEQQGNSQFKVGRVTSADDVEGEILRLNNIEIVWEG